jgi:hypothetical protein
MTSEKQHWFVRLRRVINEGGFEDRYFDYIDQWRQRAFGQRYLCSAQREFPPNPRWPRGVYAALYISAVVLHIGGVLFAMWLLIRLDHRR